MTENKLASELIQERKKGIASFDSKFIFAPDCEGRHNLKKLAGNYDAVVCGSDQIWNPVNLGSHMFMLEFVPDEVRRIALSPSFGIENLPSSLIGVYKERLKHIEYLSVREKSGVKILNDIGRKDAFWSLEPTLLLKKEKWNEIAMEATYRFEEPYIFCYFLGNSPFSRKVAACLRNISGCKLVNIPHFKSYVEEDEELADYDLYDATPQDFVLLIKNAKFVCTDSFHGTAFSVIFGKKYFVLKDIKAQTCQAQTGDFILYYPCSECLIGWLKSFLCLRI